jgi:hypothetical protein
MHMYVYHHRLVMYNPHTSNVFPTPPTPTPTPLQHLSTTHNMHDSPSNTTYPVGVALPFECDIL